MACNSGCQIFHVFLHSQHTGLVLLIGSFESQLCIYLALVAVAEFPEQGIRMLVHLLSCHADQSGSRSIRLQTALSSTGAAHAAHLDNGMTELGSA